MNSFVEVERRLSERRSGRVKMAYLAGDCKRKFDRRQVVYEPGYKYTQNGIDVTEFIRNGHCTLVSTRFHRIIRTPV